MMRRLTMITLLAIMGAYQVFAATLPTVLIANATMNVERATYDFSGIEKVSLTLFSDTGVVPTGMTLEYGSDQVVSLELAGTDSYDGIVYYWAHLPGQSPNEERFSVALAESTTEGVKSWTASVRHGFGWCGTMDSTMELSGMPIYYNN